MGVFLSDQTRGVSFSCIAIILYDHKIITAVTYKNIFKWQLRDNVTKCGGNK